MEAWRSGNWKTYNGLEGFDGPWSLLLPPEWPRMNGKRLEQIAAFQWESANRILMEDLKALPHERWTLVKYAELKSDPETTIRRLCAFAGIEFAGALSQRLAAPLPLSGFTQTPPAADKWRHNEAAILRVMPTIDSTWRHLRELT